MPELPEVEVMCARMNLAARGQTIQATKVLRQNGKYHVGTIAGGSGIVAVFRRGKKMLFQLTGGKFLIVHNAMSGYWDTNDDPWTFDYVEGTRKAIERDVRVELILDGDRRLRFHDTRLFGSMYVSSVEETEEEMVNLGPEALETPRMFPWAPVLDTLSMERITSQSKRPIKQLLMEQDKLAGVGNIYAAEALWRSSVHPLRRGDSLSTKELFNITDALQQVLKGALMRDLDYAGLQIYRRNFCPRCNNMAGKIEIAKRTTYYCPTCQEE